MAVSPWIWVAAAAAGVYAIRQRRARAQTNVPPVASNGDPLVVFFHAWGGKDSTYEPILDSVLGPLDIEYVLPHGTPVGDGRHRWWAMESTTDDQVKYATAVSAAVSKVKPQLLAYKAAGRKLLLAGHSQGAQMAATLAMQGVAPAVVAAGWVPPSLVTANPQPIVFVNGTQDPHTIFERTQEMVEQLRANGATQVRLVPVNAGHEFTGALLDAWKTEFKKAVT